MDKIELREAGSPCWLRPVQADDGPVIYAAAMESIERVGRWMGWLTPAYRVADAIAWARGASADWEVGNRYEFVIIDAVTGQVRGCCGLNRINRADLVCNLAYWVSEAAVRCGFATAAARMLGNFGIRTVGLRRIEIVVADGNVASRGVAEKLGAEYEGLQRMRLRVGPVSHDAHMYALLADRPGRPRISPAATPD